MDIWVCRDAEHDTDDQFLLTKLHLHLQRQLVNGLKLIQINQKLLLQSSYQRAFCSELLKVIEALETVTLPIILWGMELFQVISADCSVLGPQPFKYHSWIGEEMLSAFSAKKKVRTKFQSSKKHLLRGKAKTEVFDFGMSSSYVRKIRNPSY